MDAAQLGFLVSVAIGALTTIGVGLVMRRGEAPGRPIEPESAWVGSAEWDERDEWSED